VVIVTRFLQNLSKRNPPSHRGVRKSVSKRDMYRLRRNLREMPGARSKRIFREAGLPGVSKTMNPKSYPWEARFHEDYD
jgi:hypothetical protein